MTPFLTFYTPTYKRPHRLAQCLASVGSQTAVADIEQIVIPDHVGIGIGGMFARVADYAAAVHGRYVMFLCDDDVLAGPTVVEQARACAQDAGYPPLILVSTVKGGQQWPAGTPWPPQLGQIDLNCAMVRSDIWRTYASAYGARYEGDYDFLARLCDVGMWPTVCTDLVFSIGGVSRGAAEAA